MRVAVIGAGVIGLSTAVRLRQAGASATVFAAGTGQATTTSRAGAVFCPFDGADRHDWIARSFRAFEALARERPESGVRMARAVNHLLQPLTAPPAWAPRGSTLVSPLAPCLGAYAATVPHIDMTVYLDALTRWATHEHQITIHARRLASLDEPLAEGFDRVVNCTGLGAGPLANDPAVTPMRGQLLHVPNDLGLEETLDAQEPGGGATYIYTFPRHLVLGGTFELGQPLEGTRPGDLFDILRRCRELLRRSGHPRADDLGRSVLREVSGLRPARLIEGRIEGVRLEADPQEPRIVHNYGHGRAGISLSWGCAEHAVALALSTTPVPAC